MNRDEYIITICAPRHDDMATQVMGAAAACSFKISEHAQYHDEFTGKFFMRLCVSCDGAAERLPDLRRELGALAESSGLVWSLTDAHSRPRVVIMVSKFGHCLNDLLFRCKSGLLPVQIVAVVSNHDDFRSLVENYDIRFYHFPLPPGAEPHDKRRQESRILEVVGDHQADFVVLARYMQILSPQLCKALEGRAINIHHSFLPSFKGARPYLQAHERGVKLIGATAHIVTSDLDEGPIVEQCVERVDHSMSPESLSAIGRDTECIVLARAVKWFAERRVMLNGNKTIVFR